MRQHRLQNAYEARGTRIFTRPFAVDASFETHSEGGAFGYDDDRRDYYHSYCEWNGH